jgi:small GTP-binding protein
MQSLNNYSDYVFRVILIGNFGVGKSSIITKFVSDKFNPQHISTIGIDFAIRTIDIDNKSVKLQIWDTAGQERFRVITNSYYRNKDCYILVFELNNMKSFENLKTWIEDIKTTTNNDNPLFFIIGTKKDLCNDMFIVNAYIDKFIKQYNIQGYFETSNKTGTNIEDIFKQITKVLMTNENNTIKNIDNIENGILTKNTKSTINVLTSEPTTKCCYYL